MSYTYRVHRIPVNDPATLPFLAGKYSAIRLAALTTEVNSFSSTFERESTLTASQWIERLQRPLVHNFVAVAYPIDTPLSSQILESGDWIGCGVLIGPTPRSKFQLLDSGGSAVGPDETESKWHMTCVYNSPAHRGRGIAKNLIRAALDFSEQGLEVGNRSRVRIMADPSKTLLKALYAGLGFTDNGKTTLAEAYVANGQSELLPADGGSSNPEKYHSRRGIIMEWISEVKG